jgi:predicted  nucleic acid-binding Zn-ribbon protein
VNPDLRNLIALQDIDIRIVTLKKQISEIPGKTAACREETQRLEVEHHGRIAHSHELAKQRRTRESDVEMMRSKLSRLKDQLMAVKTNKEYTAMLHEIQIAEDQIRAAEDGILEIMEQMESLESILAQEAANYESKQAALRDEIRRAEEAAPGLQAEVEKLMAERIAMEGHIEANLLLRYRRIADARKGLALAEAKDELCSACHVRIRPQVFAELMRMEEIHMCDSCSRILFLREAI